jgi:hypothetical protein
VGVQEFRHPEKSAGNPVSGRNLFPKMSFCSQLTRRYVLGPSVSRRKTREGWPLLMVETEVNGDSKRTNERAPPLVGSLSLSFR